MADSLEQAAKKALEAAQAVLDHRYQMGAPTLDIHNDLATALAALRSALHQEAGEAVIYIQRDHLQKAMQAPFLCRVTTEPRSDRVPLYTSPPIKQKPDYEAAHAVVVAAGGYRNGLLPEMFAAAIATRQGSK